MSTSPNNIQPFFTVKGTLELQPHPEDIIDVAPEILAAMNARLTGSSLDTQYGDEDKVSSEFLLRLIAKKILAVFGDAGSICAKYSSVAGIKGVRESLLNLEINFDFLRTYALKKTGGQHVDECDRFTAILSNGEPITKAERFKKALTLLKQRPDKTNLLQLLLSLESTYMSENLEPLRITKETAQLEPHVRTLISERRAAAELNQLLEIFYGGVHG
jgi:hypothetical protein